MKKILCNLGFHKYSKWKLVKKTSINDELVRICNKIDKYTSITEVCIITNEKSPYIMKH